MIEFRLQFHIFLLEIGNRILDTFASNQMIKSACKRKIIFVLCDFSLVWNRNHMEKQQSELTDRLSEYASMHSVNKDINQRGHAGVGDIFNYESSNVEASLGSCQVLLLKRWKRETEHQRKHTERQDVSLEDREWPKLVY